MAPPSSIWHFPRQRTRFNHLINCGDDILEFAFLGLNSTYFSEETCSTTLSKVEPEMFTLIKNEHHGTVEIQDDQYSVIAKKRNGKNVTLPKITPHVAYNLTLDRFNQWLKQSQQDNESSNEEFAHPVRRFRQILKILVSENAFYESVWCPILIKETVDCFERGKFLSELRIKYANLLGFIWQSIEGVYMEYISQDILAKHVSTLDDQFSARIQNSLGLLHQYANECKNVRSEFELTNLKCDTHLCYQEASYKLMKEYRSCYENQRDSLQLRLDCEADKNVIWTEILKLLVCQTFAELQKHPGSVFDTLADSVIPLITSTEKWLLLASWIVRGLYANDQLLLNAIGRIIKDTWLEKLQKLEQKLNERDSLCANAFGKLRVGLREMKTIMDAMLSYSDALKFLDALNNSFSEPFAIVSRLQDLFDGEQLIYLDEKLKELEQLNDEWLLLLNKLSLFHSEEREIHYADDEVTNHINQRIKLLLNSARIRLHGENGIGRIVTNLTNDLEVWMQKGQQAVAYKNILVRNKQFGLCQTVSQAEDSKKVLHFEQLFRLLEFEIEPLRTVLHTWLLETQQAIENIGSTVKCDIFTEFPVRVSDRKQAPIPSSGFTLTTNEPSPDMAEDSVSNEACYTSIAKSSRLDLRSKERENWSLCCTHLLQWLSRMVKGIEATCARRLDEVDMVKEQLIDELASIVSPKGSGKWESKSKQTDNQVVVSAEMKSINWLSSMTTKLLNMSRGTWIKLADEQVEGFGCETLNENRINSFQILERKINSYWQSVESKKTIIVTQLSKRIVALQASKNLEQLMKSKRGGRDKASQLCYLQSTDQTIRERSIAEASSESHFLEIPIENGVQFPSDLPQTAMAYAGIKELEMNHANLNDDEIVAGECEEAVLKEEKLLSLELEKTKCLREKIESLQNELNNLQLLSKETDTALEE